MDYWVWCLTPLSTNFSYILGVSFIGGGKRTEKNMDLPQITGKLYNIMLYRLGEIRTHNIIGDTARTARFSKKSLGSDVGEIKKMSEKLKKSRC
jgi:hypothetical protein